MIPRLTKTALAPVLCIGLALVCCAGRVGHDRKEYVGEYVFTRGITPVRKPFADFVVLKENGSAIQCHFDESSGRVVTSETTWTLEENGPSGTAIIIARFRHPFLAAWHARGPSCGLRR